MLTTLDDWLEYIAGLHTSSIDLSLQRIVAIARTRQLANFSCPVITVAGTNGKGSCVRLLESIYSAAGYRVGAYYSPHLHHFNERICLQQQPIDEASIVAAFARIESYRHGQSLSFFEFVTLAALSVLQAATLDVILLEVGLGGRLDAVNVVESDVAMVTSIGLDHMAWLGDSREQIAVEKAGVYRPGKPAICGDRQPPHSLRDKAAAIGAKFLGIDEAFHYQIDGCYWHWWSQHSRYQQLPMPLLKCQNAATSLMAVECLADRLPVTTSAIATGLVQAKLDGRFQRIVLPTGRQVVLDVAHNADSARWLAEQLANLSPKISWLAVIAMLNDKDIAGTLAPLLPHVQSWFVGKLAVDRAAEPQRIVQQLTAFGIQSCYNSDSVSMAFEQALEACQHSQQGVIVFGSFHTVAMVQKQIRGARTCK